MTRFKALLAVCAAALPTAALAEPATSTGSSAARIVEPLAIQSLKDLRFGSFIRPTAAGTVTIAADSTVTTTGGLDPTLFPTGRGAAQYLVLGTANRQFVTFLPASITITSGSASMLVDQFRKNGGVGPNGLNSSGFYLLDIGGRLNVTANQAPGNYSGTLTVQVLYQ